MKAGARPLRGVRFRALIFASAVLAGLAGAGSLSAQVGDGGIRLEDPRRVLDLHGTWRFSTSVRPALDGAPRARDAWKTIQVPGQWHLRGILHEGVAWYRLEIHAGENFAGRDLGLILPYTSAAHEVYFNGRFIGGGGRVMADGRLHRPDSRTRNYVLPGKYLRMGGPNVLMLRVRSYGPVGGFLMPGLYLGDATRVSARFFGNLVWNAMLTAIFFFVGLGQLITFLGRRKEIYYLYFALLAFCIGCMVISLRTLSYWLFDSYFVNLLLLNLAVCTLPIWLTGFIDRYFGYPRGLSARLLTIVPALLAVISMTMLSLGPRTFGAWAIYLVPAALLLISVSVLRGLYLTARAIPRRLFGAVIIMGGFFLFALAVGNDILSHLHILRTPRFLEAGFLCFIFALATAMTLKFSALHRERETLTNELRQRNRELETARLVTEESERKYRELVESSHDIIFSLNDQGIVVTMNGAVRKHLGISPHSVVGKSFSTLVAHGEKSSFAELNEHILAEKLERVLREKSTVTFRMAFLTQIREPRELHVRLEYTSTEQGPVVLGKAVRAADDELGRLRVSERQRFVIGNYFTMAELISRRIAFGLGRYTDEDSAAALRISIRELLINAIEHGNLDIDYNDKTEAQSRGDYFEFLAERQRMSKYQDRQVTVDYSLNPRRAVIRIADEGDGFDHRRVLRGNPDKANEQGLQHGRGIFMARGEFDVIRYNEKGNVVRLVKYFPPEDDAIED